MLKIKFCCPVWTRTRNPAAKTLCDAISLQDNMSRWQDSNLRVLLLPKQAG